MWGIVPSIGSGSRVGREIAPLGGLEGEGQRPRVLGDELLRRLSAAGVTQLCLVVPRDGLDLVAFFGAEVARCPVAYVVQPRPAGLCDAVFRALPFLRPEDQVVVGLPGTVWFPEHAVRLLGDGAPSFLCFPAEQPGRLETVVAGDDGEVRRVEADPGGTGRRWIWGAFKLDGATLRALHDLWCERGREDQEMGPLVSAWIGRGGSARAVMAGEIFVDASTDRGLREAATLVARRGAP
jgi:dTDP-glucose pyrophosphorylase